MPTALEKTRPCPRCGAIVPKGQFRCLVCRLEVSRFDATEAELTPKRRREEAARSAGGPWFTRKPPLIAAALVIALLISLLFLRGKPAHPAWLDFPSSKELAASTFLSAVSTGREQDAKDAYALIAPANKNLKDPDDYALYDQTFTEVNKYLSGEFGDGWFRTATFTQDPDDPNVVDAHIDVETLHIRTALQNPPGTENPGNLHYAIAGIDEFDIHDATDFQHMEAVTGAMRMLGASGSQVKQLGSVLAAGQPRHETRMQAKIRLLPAFRDPHRLLRRALLEAWPVRKDPVIRRRLQMITTDGRYDPLNQETAKKILTNQVDEEELVAIGLDPDSPG